MSQLHDEMGDRPMSEVAFIIGLCTGGALGIHAACYLLGWASIRQAVRERVDRNLSNMGGQR